MPNDDAFMQLASMLNGLEQALKIHRDVTFRAISQLNIEVIGFSGRLDKDDEARAKRQRELDAKLQSIEDSQRMLRLWQWIRIGIELATILIVVAFWLGGR